MTTTSKRSRLIEASKAIFYQQGVARTSLADIAQQARVPLGNVYYHFRTKEALVEAVIQAHIQEIQAKFALWEHDPDPRRRLLALLTEIREEKDTYVRYGCPYGSLCQELNKDNSQLAILTAQTLQRYLDWAEIQFRQISEDEQEAKDRAIDLIVSLQGIQLLTSSFRSPELLERKLQRLTTWIRGL